MISRRLFCGCLSAAGTFAATAVHAQTACSFFTPDRQKNTTPDQALQLLKDGNERMLSGKSVNCDMNGMFKNAAAGQAPMAAIVACIDSRAAPEIIFDQDIGDVFVARVAGNIVNPDIIGSLEYATKVAGAKAIVVIGHNKCGAIKSAVDKVKMGPNIAALLKNFQPALKTLTPADGHLDSHNDPLVQKVAEMNAKMTAASLTKRSRVLKDLVAAGQLKIVAAMEDIGSGKVVWL